MLIARTWDPYWRKKAQNWLFGELGKLLGRKYKELSVLEEKAKYDVLAAADKVRYERENNAYESKKWADAGYDVNFDEDFDY